MRILLLTQWFPPEPRPMYAEMATGLKALGHEVQVVTGFPNWPGGRIYPGYRIRLAQWEEMDGVRVLRLPLIPDHSRSRWKRALNLTSLSLSFLTQGLWRIRRPDVIHVVQLPTLAWSAVLLGVVWRCPMTLEIQDMWPESLSATGMVESGTALKLVERLCAWTYRRAVKIRVISPGFRQNLLTKGVPTEKITIVPNWTNPESDYPVAADGVLGERLGTCGKFNVLYAGSIGLPQGLESVLHAAKRIQHQIPDVQFLFAGDGVELPLLRQMAEQMGLANVRFLGQMPQAAMPALYALADVLLVHLRDDPLFAITVPSKLLTYLAYGKPILAAVAGDAAAVVESAGAGIVCRPQDPQALTEAVRALHEASPEKLRSIGRAARTAAEQVYHRNVLVPMLAKMIEEAVGRR